MAAKYVATKKVVGEPISLTEMVEVHFQSFSLLTTQQLPLKPPFSQTPTILQPTECWRLNPHHRSPRMPTFGSLKGCNLPSEGVTFILVSGNCFLTSHIFWVFKKLQGFSVYDQLKFRQTERHPSTNQEEISVNTGKKLDGYSLMRA